MTQNIKNKVVNTRTTLLALGLILILLILSFLFLQGGGMVVPYNLTRENDGMSALLTFPSNSVSLPVATPTVAIDTTSSLQVVSQSERLIVRTGVLSLVVDDPRASGVLVEQMVAEMAGEGAFVVSSNEQASGGDRPPTINMLIRVPVARFDDAMDRTAALAKDVLIRNTAAQDVTEEYVDLQAQLASMEVARDRLLEIMEEARTTKDLLEIEQQLAERNARIDSIKARLQYLEQTASLSSIQIDFHPSVASQTVIPGWHPDDTARQAIERFVQRFQDTIDWWIVFGIADLPWLLVYGLIIFVAARFGLRWWRKRQSTGAVSTANEAPPPTTSSD